MNTLLISVLSLIGGVFLAVQAGFNSQLGQALKNPIVAVAISSLISFILTAGYLMISGKSFPSWPQVTAVPSYLWIVGGLFSVIGISIYFYSIPKIGISTMITLGLSGQLLFAIVAGHFGWLNLPREPLTLTRVLGALSLLAGIILINSK